jgi:hypothetical protein
MSSEKLGMARVCVSSRDQVPRAKKRGGGPVLGPPLREASRQDARHYFWVPRRGMLWAVEWQSPQVLNCLSMAAACGWPWQSEQAGIFL